MARAVEPRPRSLAVGFAGYVVVLAAAAYWFSPQIGPYVDPGATFWISTAYVLLGALALVGICGAALLRARDLEVRLGELEAIRRRVEELENPAPPPLPDRLRRTRAVTDSGSAEQEVEALLDGLAGVTERLHSAPRRRPAPRPGSSTVEELLRGDTWEMGRLRRARDAVGAVAAGPALAAAVLLGVFAPLLPASDGMLLSNLPLAAFLGVTGLGVLLGLPVYAAVAFHQIRVRGP